MLVSTMSYAPIIIGRGNSHVCRSEAPYHSSQLAFHSFVVVQPHFSDYAAISYVGYLTTYLVGTINPQYPSHLQSVAIAQVLSPIRRRLAGTLKPLPG
jgi:hypothetical protein